MAFPEYISDTTVSSTLYVLTSIPEIHRRFSRQGVELHTDDISPADERYDENNDSEVNANNFLFEQVQRSSSWVMARLAPRYNVVDVYRNPRLRDIATYHACHEITRRRGNEPVYAAEVAEALDELDDYRMGVLYLDAPSNGQRAYFQSGIVDNRYMRLNYRINQDASTSVIPGQNLVYRLFSWI